MLGEQTEGCALSKGDYLASEKIIKISLLFFLEYLISFVFFKFLTSLKNNKIMLRYKGENKCRKQENWFQEHGTYRFSGKGDMCRIRTLMKNSSMGQGVRPQRKTMLQGLHIRNALKVQLRVTWRQNQAKDVNMRPIMRLSTTQ
jgi:hypothetical protein